jgi:uncharacterized protein YkwD
MMRKFLVRIVTLSGGQIPQKGEGQSGETCHGLRVLRSTLALAAIVLLALPATAGAGLTRTESLLIREMNRVRAQHGLRRLHYDPTLERAARAHSRVMLRKDVFAHGAFRARLLQFGVTAAIAGENLAWGTGTGSTSRATVVAWLASPEHRANLLQPSFTRIGVGALVGSFLGRTGARVVTADFAG